MSTLTIRDLAHSAEMGRNEMSAVRGGNSVFFPSYPSFQSSFDLSATVQQLATQSQNTKVVNGNNVAFAQGITADTDPHQDAKNTSNINVFPSSGLVRAL
ncbi:hypothetical protein AWB79_03279 [Caballeronia hypogeia]|uniref:Uncharacterized protein n=1 Tax=Caballeronia hypogeia TaxID=1777140 RepID=A0A158B7C8_9BURK|nr:hypothetical protein [Caballeronia hypogeia]SAK65963.1 hypothetical protein AWB79_03279 [Caballeronia hypogeia]